VIVLALQALQDAGVLDDMNLVVAFLGDEEDTGDPLTVSRRDLVEAARRSAFGLGFEGGVGGRHSATVARRGFTGWKLTVTGTPGHSSLIFKPAFGSGAVFELARILNGFRQELEGEEYLTFNPGVALLHHREPTRCTGGNGVRQDQRHRANRRRGGRSPYRVARAAERTKQRMRDRRPKPAGHVGDDRVRRLVTAHVPEARQLRAARAASGGGATGQPWRIRERDADIQFVAETLGPH
jgi:acetylornithine deacetylase/succinyl-diaminopimelate desuccinylase-like protein